MNQNTILIIARGHPFGICGKLKKLNPTGGGTIRSLFYWIISVFHVILPMLMNTPSA